MYHQGRDFKPEKHKKYLKRCLSLLPASCQSFDTTRSMIAYFALSGLDILNALNELANEDKDNIIKWLYSLQVVDNEELTSGFQCSPTYNTPENRGKNQQYKWSHLAGTYCALTSLVILGDDLENVNKEAISNSLRKLQLPNGCFTASVDGTESDMRFMFCAASVCYILDDWSGMDVERAIDFILKSISYDSGIAQGPHLESHGGSSYCAIASLALMRQLPRLAPHQLHGLRRWLLSRQEDGFQGRPNKPVDTCYSFWVGGSLKILDAFQLINREKNREYLMMAQDGLLGGFAKWVETGADPLHTYMGLAGLSLMGGEGLNEVFAPLNVTKRAHAHLQRLHGEWGK